MVCPEGYIAGQNNKSYSDLLKERDSLIERIQDFEEKMRTIDETDDEFRFRICTSPTPEVIYQMNLLYLGKLCELIAEAYAQDDEY